jgi:hypothetical protein
VFRRIYGVKDEISEKFMITHKEKLHDLNMLSSIIRKVPYQKLRWTDHVAKVGKAGNVYGTLTDRNKLHYLMKHKTINILDTGSEICYLM